jgi:hypothetical protein
VVALLTVLLMIGAALAARSVRARPLAFDLSWHVIGAGGGHSSNAPYVLDGTVGQAVADTVILAGPYDLCAGFWCSEWLFVREDVYLPVVLRDG